MSRRKPRPMQGDLFADYFAHRGARNTDPETSKVAAKSVSMRSDSQRARLLRTYSAEPQIDEQAAQAAGVNMRSCWWKRCSELRELGFIEPVEVFGVVLTIVSSQGEACRAHRITDAGMEWCRANPV